MKRIRNMRNEKKKNWNRKEEQKKETMIITLDDDTKICPLLFEQLVYYSSMYPDYVISREGQNIGNFPSYVSHTFEKTQGYKKFLLPCYNHKSEFVDILMGFSGVLYKRKFFPQLHDTAKWKLFFEISFFVFF